MRKVVSIVVMFASILSIWGQNEEFAYENVKDIISELKSTQEEVLAQANVSKIEQSDKDKAKDVLSSTFKRLDNVMSVYDQIKQDPELKKEAEEIIVNFINSYKSAILDAKGEKIQISSRRFIAVAEQSSPKLDAFYQKADKYIKSDSHTSGVSANVSNGLGSNPINNADVESNDNGTKAESLDNAAESSLLSWIAWIALTVGVLSLLLSISALVKIKHEHNRISTRKQELEDAERRINQKISEIKPSSFRGNTASYVPTQHQCQPKPQPRRQQTVVTPPAHREENVQRVKMTAPSVVTYLYATIKAQSPYAEFFKVATENYGDKVFMLTLTNPESDVAEFTIAPNMSPDFMASVIIDRDTYLPSLFCEKIMNSSNPTRIEVKSVGRAKKVDGKWQVQERMSIRLV